MSGSHEFYEATPEERLLFGNRQRLRALDRLPAAEPNRTRQVWRLQHDGQTYFLKEFGPTSWQNGWRFANSLPHARDDAEREALVTLGLRREGIEAPRPIARGRDEHGSYYVCAEMHGTSLRQHLLRGTLPRATLALAASFCGDLLRKGHWLPDLSADHVFARQEIAFLHFGVLDLHNGRRAMAGPPPAWLCRRVLRHFARSVHDLAIPRLMALRFAARMLRNAGRGPMTRRLLQKLPVLDTAWRYEQRGKAHAYAERNPARTARELDLLAEVWPGRDDETVLDVPCGAGRLLDFLRQRGHRCIWADGALAMVQEARRRQQAPPAAVQAHALQLPLGDRSVDGVVQFRFLHHLPPAAAKTAVAEACRVARRFVVASFFHPCSSHHWQRRLRQLLAGRPPTRFAWTTTRLDGWFAKHGFRRVSKTADAAFRKDLWLCAYERVAQ